MHTSFRYFSQSLTISIQLFSFFLFFTLIFSSCIPPDIKETAQTDFFDLKGFLDSQINSLEKKEFSLLKKTVLQEQKSEQTLKKINWKDEFAFFYSSDINTPQLRDRYNIEKTSQKWIFKTDEEHLLVKEMQIIFVTKDDFSFQNVNEIIIFQKDKNQIYENDRALNIKVKNGVLESYSIKGSEDVILNEKQEFLVEGIIK